MHSAANTSWRRPSRNSRNMSKEGLQIQLPDPNPCMHAISVTSRNGACIAHASTHSHCMCSIRFVPKGHRVPDKRCTPLALIYTIELEFSSWETVPEMFAFQSIPLQDFTQFGRHTDSCCRLTDSGGGASPLIRIVFRSTAAHSET